MNILARQQDERFDTTDLAIFASSTGIALVGALRLVQEDEPFLYMTSMSLALGFLVTSITVARSQRATSIPWFSVFHIAFWIVQFAYALHSGTAQHAINAHQRVSDHLGWRHAVVWVVMGSVGGFYPGTVKSKLILFVGSTFFVTARNVVLAMRWEQSRPLERGWSRSLATERSPDVATLLGEVLETASGGGRAAPPRLSTELILNGWHCFTGAMLLGLGLGMLTRARSHDKAARRMADTQAELSELQALHLRHEESIEQLRREKERE